MFLFFQEKTALILDWERRLAPSIKVSSVVELIMVMIVSISGLGLKVKQDKSQSASATKKTQVRRLL